MKTRISAAELLGVGLAVVLALVTSVAGVSAQGLAWPQTQPLMSVDTADFLRNDAADSAPSTFASSTAAFTIYLPASFSRFDPSGCSNTPTLVSPPDSSRVDSLMPLYQWNWGANPDATETHFEVALDPEFTQLRYWSQSTGLNGTTNRPVYNRPFTNLTPDTTHYWRVFLKCGPNRTLYSDVWSFIPNSGGPILPPPLLVAPPNNAQVPAWMVTLQWSPLSGATRYIVRYKPLGGLDQLHITSDVAVTVGPLNAATTYVWSVSAVNDYAIGNRSEQWRFTTP